MTGADKCPRSNGGRMQTLYTDEMILSTLKAGEQTTPAQVAEKLGCNIVVARNKLKSLHSRGQIEADKLTGRWVFWLKN